MAQKSDCNFPYDAMLLIVTREDESYSVIKFSFFKNHFFPKAYK
jgi:hypothetical protein